MEREKEKRNKTKTLAHKEEKTGKEKNKTSCTEQPVSRGGRVCVFCIPLLKWAQAAFIKSVLLKPFLSFLQPFCSPDRAMSPVYPWAGSAGPRVVSDLPSSLDAISWGMWHLQPVPFPAPLLGWSDPRWAPTDVNSPCPAPKWGASSEPEAVSCSQHHIVDELTKYITWTGVSSEPGLRNSQVSLHQPAWKCLSGFIATANPRMKPVWRSCRCVSSRRSQFAGWGGWDGSDREVETCAVYSLVRREHNESFLLIQHLLGGQKMGANNSFDGEKPLL